MKIDKDKTTSSQIEMEKDLALVLLNRIQIITKLASQKKITRDGITVEVAEIGLNGYEFDMTIALTPKGVLDKFKILTNEEMKRL